jgi:hypothetical protein
VNNTEIPILKRWTRDLSGLPAFNYELLTKHLGTEQSGGAHKHKKLGYQMFKDKYVGQVEVKANVIKDNISCFLIKAGVNAAMKNITYTVYVHLNEANGEVVYSNCTCKAGKGGQCKHIVALLFQIIEYKQLDMTEIPDHLTCTQLLQQWHVPRKDESDEAVLYESIVFKKAVYEKDIKKNNKRKRSQPPKEEVYNPTPDFAKVVEQTEIEKLASKLNVLEEKSYLGSLLGSNDCKPYAFEAIHQELPAKKRHTESLTLNLNDTAIRDKVLDNLQPTSVERSYSYSATVQTLKHSANITHSEILQIEKNTRDQSSSDTWFDERHKRLTSSNFGAVVKRRKKIFPKSLLNKIQNQSKQAKCPEPCQWGKDKEGKAIIEYCKFKNNERRGINVCSKCGFVVNIEFPWLGASPDFLIFDQTEEKPFGIGEVKCPFSKKDVCIEEACKDKNFCLGMADGKIQLKKTHNYYYQIQGCMATLNVSWCDFVVFTNIDLHVERIHFDNDFWHKIVPELSSFYSKYLLPEL